MVRNATNEKVEGGLERFAFLVAPADILKILKEGRQLATTLSLTNYDRFRTFLCILRSEARRSLHLTEERLRQKIEAFSFAFVL